MARTRIAGVVLGAAALSLLAACDGSDPQDLEEFFESARDAVDQVEDVVDEIDDALADVPSRPEPPDIEPLAQTRERLTDEDGSEFYRENSLYDEGTYEELIKHYTEVFGEPPDREGGPGSGEDEHMVWFADDTIVIVWEPHPDGGVDVQSAYPAESD